MSIKKKTKGGLKTRIRNQAKRIPPPNFLRLVVMCLGSDLLMYWWWDKKNKTSKVDSLLHGNRWFKAKKRSRPLHASTCYADSQKRQEPGVVVTTLVITLRWIRGDGVLKRSSRSRVGFVCIDGSERESSVGEGERQLWPVGIRERDGSVLLLSPQRTTKLAVHFFYLFIYLFILKEK